MAHRYTCSTCSEKNPLKFHTWETWYKHILNTHWPELPTIPKIAAMRNALEAVGGRTFAVDGSF
jgi:hypothetical protein